MKQDFVFTIMSSDLKLSELVDNIHLEGTVSQIFYLGPTFYFMSKNGKLFIRFHKIKTRA